MESLPNDMVFLAPKNFVLLVEQLPYNQGISIRQEPYTFPPVSTSVLSESLFQAPRGSPPSQVQPGAIGEAGYSPLVELPNGVILNAPHIMNASGKHDSAHSIDTNSRTVDLEAVDGFCPR